MRREIIDMNIFNSVFVDCTASSEVADIYEDLLAHNVSIVAANKIAASSSYDRYARLKQTARENDIKFLFETNVGAGLPIINTINALINSGDRILRIQAVLSGTLNFVFNRIAADVPLSRAVKMAQESGYSEPDPRIDLSGKDVIRKLVILARESGYRVEFEDVESSFSSRLNFSRVHSIISGSSCRRSMPTLSRSVSGWKANTSAGVLWPSGKMATARFRCAKSRPDILSTISRVPTISSCSPLSDTMIIP